MNILDELRQKAEEKKQSQYQQSLAEQKLERTYQDILLPKMQFLYDSLKELVEYLNFLEEPVPVRHYCLRYPQFGTLYQKHYKINTDGRMGMGNYHRLMQINVSFFCEGEGSFNYILSTKHLIDMEHSFLFDRGLTFQQKNKNQDKALFIVERKIPVRFQILVDYPNSKLKVNIFNHENFQFFQKNFVAEQLDDEFLDSFLSYFLRRDSRFVQTDISEQEKAAILDHIAPYYEEQKRIWSALADSAQEQANHPIANPVKKIFAKFNK